jgi:hypothetical protein
MVLGNTPPISKRMKKTLVLMVRLYPQSVLPRCQQNGAPASWRWLRCTEIRAACACVRTVISDSIIELVVRIVWMENSNIPTIWGLGYNSVSSGSYALRYWSSLARCEEKARKIVEPACAASSRHLFKGCKGYRIGGIYLSFFDVYQVPSNAWIWASGRGIMCGLWLRSFDSTVRDWREYVELSTNQRAALEINDHILIFSSSYSSSTGVVRGYQVTSNQVGKYPFGKLSDRQCSKSNSTDSKYSSNRTILSKTTI